MSADIFQHWPNRLTALRFLGSLVLFTLLALAGQPTVGEVHVPIQVGFWLFIVVALTDILDGYLARRHNVVSTFGRIADPFVDKVLVIGTMVFLATLDWSREWFPAWIVVIVLAREFLVTGIRGYAESIGAEFPADWFGKVKMLLQCWAIGVVMGMFSFGLSEVEFWRLVAHALVWGTLITSVGSGLQYVLRMKRILGSAPTENT